MKFLELTDCDNNELVLVNPKHVVCIYKNKDGNTTVSVPYQVKYYKVKESVSEINRQLNNIYA